MLLFDNKACRFAMAVGCFSTPLGLLHIRPANHGYAEKAVPGKERALRVS